MLMSHKFRIRLLPAVVLSALLVSMPRPAHAASKEIIELQTQVQQLLDMVQRLQSTIDSRFGILQNLTQQTADNAAQVTAAVNALQQKINTQNDATNGRLDTTSGQIQSLNDSVDEMKSRLAKLDKTIQDMQTQLQNIQSPPQAVAPGTSVAPGTPPPDGGAAPPSAPPAAVSPAPSQAPPLQATFQAGVRDYNAARYDVAAGEFQAVLQYYPLDELSGSAEFYLGEIAYHQQDYAAAVKSYNAVLEGFSGSPKAPAAQLRKGLALIQLGKKEAGIHELRALIQRHPQTPEAAQARSKLNGMGVRIAAK